MSRFGRLEIEAFLTIGEATVDLDGRGLIHISGESDETAADSNGAGKSSVADAIAWVCWGETARGVGADDVINATLGKGTRVKLPILDGADSYEIVRHRKHPKGKNSLQVFANGVEITKGTTSETQKLIEKILGCSQEVFNASIYAGQEAMPDLPAMADKQLKLLVEQAAGVDVLSRAYEVARERMRAASQTRADAQIALDRSTDRHAHTRAQIDRQTQARDTWTRDQAGRVQRARQAAIDAATEAKAQKDAHNPQDAVDLQTEIDATRQVLASVSAERDRERLLASEAQQAVSALSGLEARVSQAADQVRQAKRKSDAVKSSVGTPCGECGKPHTAADLDTAQTLADKRLQEAAAVYTDAKGKRDAVVTLRDAAEKALGDHRAGMTDVSVETGKLSALGRELAIVEGTGREVDRLVQRAHMLADEFKRVAAETNPHDDLLGQLDGDLKAAAADLDRADRSVSEASELLDYANAVVDVFAPAGVRAHRLDEATPYLNERTAHYLGSLTDGAIEAYWTTLTLARDGKTLREQFSIAVQKQGSAAGFKPLSGGEKRKVRLSCALALQDLVCSRAAKSIELFVGDEIDDALDPAGLERLMGVLEEKARERGTVLIISHNDIAHYARQHLIVAKQNGISSVREA